ncbi:MAG TPA: nucleoside triphosphate pyrophosphohydrolase, partial [Syntrophomonas sp.]|nr:nucleoside triphosphate pyrophosphohydrolase [Syntrophomonas sp.]
RFNYIEEAVKDSGHSWSELSLEELDYYWNQAKEKGL